MSEKVSYITCRNFAGSIVYLVCLESSLTYRELEDKLLSALSFRAVKISNKTKYSFLLQMHTVSIDRKVHEKIVQKKKYGWQVNRFIEIHNLAPPSELEHSIMSDCLFSICTFCIIILENIFERILHFGSNFIYNDKWLLVLVTKLCFKASFL